MGVRACVGMNFLSVKERGYCRVFDDSTRAIISLLFCISVCEYFYIFLICPKYFALCNWCDNKVHNKMQHNAVIVNYKY